MRIGSPSSGSRRGIARLAGFGLLGLLVAVALALGPPWLEVWAPGPVRLAMLIGLLEAGRSAYLALLAVLPATILALTAALGFARRRGASRIRMARALACCAALAIGMAMAEGGAAAWLAATAAGRPRLTTRFPDAPLKARAPEPTLKADFPDAPTDRTVDIIVLGESSAHGDPYDRWLSVGEIVTWKLREAMPDRRFSFRCLARSGSTLDRMHRTLETLERRPDLAILYAGHNEISMRHEWDHDVPHYYRDAGPPAPRLTFVDQVRAHSPVCRLIDETIMRRRLASPPSRTSRRRLVDVPAYEPAEYAEWLRDFRDRLEAMTSYCERVGALVVLVIPPGNDADFEPSRSFLPPETPRAEREAFASEFEAARRRERSDPGIAVAAYRRLLERQPGFAEAHYRLARLEERAGHRDEAVRHYIAARDRDGLPVRCMSEFQDAYRAVAARHPGAILIDGPALFRQLSRRGVAGDNFFTDAMHPSLIGYTMLAREILRGLHARRAFGWGAAAPAPAPEVTPSQCADHFGMDPAKWRAVGMYAGWFYYHAAAVRFDPSARMAKRHRYDEAIHRIEAGIAPDDLGIPGIGTRLVPAPQIAVSPGEAPGGGSSGSIGDRDRSS